MSLSQELKKKFNKSISNDVNLSNYSWFNLGGPAEYLFKPDNKNQLIEFLKENKKNNLNITILGAGSNTLIRDNGIKGVVIKLGANFSNITVSMVEISYDTFFTLIFFPFFWFFFTYYNSIITSGKNV